MSAHAAAAIPPNQAAAAHKPAEDIAIYPALGEMRFAGACTLKRDAGDWRSAQWRRHHGRQKRRIWPEKTSKLVVKRFSGEAAFVASAMFDKPAAKMPREPFAGKRSDNGVGIGCRIAHGEDSATASGLPADA